jgi:hypothetical protein
MAHVTACDALSGHAVRCEAQEKQESHNALTTLSALAEQDRRLGDARRQRGLLAHHEAAGTDVAPRRLWCRTSN